jgi:hypothetical protein
MKKRGKYLLRVRKSRKSYFPFYIMVFIVFFSLLYLYQEGYELTSEVLTISLVFILGIFLLVEVLHRREWWAITETALIHSISILNKNVREVGFSSISDMDLDKPLYKRFLGYGNVNIRIFLNETTIRVKNINSPEKFIKLLQDLISKNRRETNVAKQY